jgi:hypothetical protein
MCRRATESEEKLAQAGKATEHVIVMAVFFSRQAV